MPRTICKSLLLLFVCAVLGRAAEDGPFGIGAKFGVPLNDALDVKSPNPFDYAADTRRYTVGPFLELRLPAGFAVELDALYKPYAFRLAVPSPVSNSSSSWEFPLMAKYKILPGPVKPFIEGGVAFAHLYDTGDIAELSHHNTWGIVAGGGIEIVLGHVHIPLEIRYNNWTRRFFDAPGSYLQSNRNQATALVGISF